MPALETSSEYTQNFGTRRSRRLPRLPNHGTNGLEVRAPESANDWEQKLDGASTGRFIATSPSSARVDAAGVVDESVGCSGLGIDPRDLIVPHAELDNEEDLSVVLVKLDGIASGVVDVAVASGAMTGVFDPQAEAAVSKAVDDNTGQFEGRLYFLRSYQLGDVGSMPGLGGRRVAKESRER